MPKGQQHKIARCSRAQLIKSARSIERTRARVALARDRSSALICKNGWGSQGEGGARKGRALV